MSKDQAALKSWFAKANERLELINQSPDCIERDEKLQCAVHFDAEDQVYCPMLHVKYPGKDHHAICGEDWFSSRTYYQLLKQAEREAQRFKPEVIFRSGVKTHSVGSGKAFFDQLLKEARKGIAIQHYRGLGEMNPRAALGNNHEPRKPNLARS